MLPQLRMEPVMIIKISLIVLLSPKASSARCLLGQNRIGFFFFLGGAGGGGEGGEEPGATIIPGRFTLCSSHKPMFSGVL